MCDQIAYYKKKHKFVEQTIISIYVGISFKTSFLAKGEGIDLMVFEPIHVESILEACSCMCDQTAYYKKKPHKCSKYYAFGAL